MTFAKLFLALILSLSLLAQTEGDRKTPVKQSAQRGDLLDINGATTRDKIVAKQRK